MISGDIKRIAAPGRRSSNRRRKFRGDGLVEGIDYEPGDGDFFEDDLEDDEAYDYDNHIRPSDLQKQLEAQAIKDLEAQKRVSKELEALSAINAGNTRTAEDAAAEKLLRDIQLRASQDDRRRRESLKLEEDKRLTEVAAAEKSRKFEQLQEDLEKQRRKMEKEEDEEEEKRKLAAAINTERIQRDAELLFEKAQQENRALVDEISAEKTRKANAQRLKREVFLNDVNAFSETIEQQAARSSGVRQLSANGAVCEQYKIQSVRFADEPPSFSHQPPSPHADTPRIRSSSDADAPHSFNELTSSLFAANSASTAAHIERNGDRGNRSDIWGDRRDYPNINSAANVTAQRAESYRREQEHQSENEQEQSERHDGGGDEVSQTDEEEEEEGMGGASSISNILTIDERRELSVEQKVAWRALQADLTTRRKEFHGAVTYAFDGIFSWQMYGSTEAAEDGKAYTEYLMRCQWGTTWENMQPWIVARRYREFDVLNFQLRRSFPSQASVIHTLPEKDFFRYMDPHVVERRRKALEEYVTRIVQRLPTVLRSKNMDEFLGISDRIKTIRTLLGPGMTLLSSSQSVPSSSSSSSSSGLRSREVSRSGAVEDDPAIAIMSVEAAEAAREQQGTDSLDEDSLGRLEEDIRDLGHLLSTASPLDTTRPCRLRELMRSTTTRWPSLRSTAALGGNPCPPGAQRNTDRDFCLIPRALQAEEDLLHIIDNYRSLVFAGSLM